MMTSMNIIIRFFSFHHELQVKKKKRKKEKEKCGESGRRITSFLPFQFCLLHGQPLVLGHVDHRRTVPVALILTVTCRG